MSAAAAVNVFDPAAPWEDQLHTLTPVVQGERLLWKRDDLFEPPDGYGINGAKVRFLTWLIHRAVVAGATEVITGGSVLSPQIARSAVIGAHYGLPVTVVLGGTTPETAGRHLSIRIAMATGATLEFVRVGYNPVIQKRLRELAAERPGAYRVPYGISVPDDADPAEMHAFHDLGARQVDNLPDTVRTLVVPLGSGNTAASVVLGLARRTPFAFERLALIGIGPDRTAWLRRRLDGLSEVAGIDLNAFMAAHAETVNLHEIGFTTYAKRVRYAIDGVTGHPVYEAKVLKYLDEAAPPWWVGNDPAETCMWIVGGEKA